MGSFPSQAAQVRKRKLEGLEKEINVLKKRKMSNGAAIEAAKEDRSEGGDRKTLLEELDVKEKMLKAITSEVLKYKECDPDLLEVKKTEINSCKEAINRWTDNIFSVQSWCKSKFGIDSKTMSQNFGIPEELDYID